MRKQIHTFLTKKPAIILVILLTATLILIDGNTGYFFGLFFALIVFWASKFNWLTFGFGKPNLKKAIPKSLVLAALIFIIVDIVFQPFIELYFGAIDLSALDDIRGNLTNYIVFMVVMWVFAAFGEEFLYRGFFMKRLALVLGDTDRDWLISAILISILFGIAHYYQGPSGMISTGLIGFCYALIFYKNRNNLTMAVLTHGFYNMIGITLIYLNQESAIANWIQGFM